MFKLARWIGSTLSTIVGLYVFFFVPIGRRTLFDHAKRVAMTPEAREFGDEMRTAGARVAERTRDEVEGALRHGVLTDTDGGLRQHSALDPPSAPPPHLLPELVAQQGATTQLANDGGVGSRLLQLQTPRATRLVQRVLRTR